MLVASLGPRRCAVVHIASLGSRRLARRFAWCSSPRLVLVASLGAHRRAWCSSLSSVLVAALGARGLAWFSSPRLVLVASLGVSSPHSVLVASRGPRLSTPRLVLFTPLGPRRVAWCSSLCSVLFASLGAYRVASRNAHRIARGSSPHSMLVAALGACCSYRGAFVTLWTALVLLLLSGRLGVGSSRRLAVR